MKQYIIPTLLSVLIFTSCSDSKKDGQASINDKKAALEKLKSEKEKNDQEIAMLQAELLKLDPNSNPSKVKLVATAPIVKQDFNHYIELQGKVDVDDISYISPRGMGGQVTAIYVKQGDVVRKGQLLLKLDDAIMRQQVTAAKQQLEGIKIQMGYAKNIAQRQKNLWDQGIGTEVQLITAQNNVSALEEQLKSGNESVKLAQEQLNTGNIYSNVSGVADVVNIRVGEIFTGMTVAGAQIKIVNTSRLKVVSKVVIIICL